MKKNPALGCVGYFGLLGCDRVDRSLARTVLERPTTNRRPEQLFFRATTNQVDQELRTKHVRLASFVQRRANAADSATLSRLGIVDDHADEHGIDAICRALASNRTITAATEPADVQRPFAAALRTCPGVRRPLTHTADSYTVHPVRQRQFVATARACALLAALVATMTDVLIGSEFFAHRFGLTACHTVDQTVVRLVAQRADRLVSVGPSRHHSLLPANTALLLVLAFTGALNTDRLIVLIPVRYNPRMVAATTRRARLARSLVALCAGWLLRLLVEVDIRTIMATDSTAL